MVTVAKAAGWWWPFRNAVVLTDRPHTLRRDDQHRLHGVTGPALQYPDGWGIWAWHGVRVPQQVIECPNTLTIPQIRDEPNLEVRRVMLERFGLERYLRESGAREIHKDDWGTLFRSEIPGDEPLVMLMVVNSTPEPDGSYRDFMVRVPPEMQTSQQAWNWTYERRPDEARPLVES